MSGAHIEFAATDLDVPITSDVCATRGPVAIRYTDSILCICYAMPVHRCQPHRVRNAATLSPYVGRGSSIQQGTPLRACYTKPGTSLVLTHRNSLPGVLPPTRGSTRGGACAGRFEAAYVRATRCPVLIYRIVLWAYAFAVRCLVPTKQMVRSACSSPGTNTAYGAIGLHACYATSGTDLAYGATVCGSEAMVAASCGEGRGEKGPADH
eukprot:237154-Rhodomonas_salina.3